MITEPDKNISGDSKNWKNVVSVFLPNTCKPCEEKHGTIFSYDAIFKGWHPHCQCYLARMRTKKAGTATKDGLSGVDALIMYTGKLPEKYVTSPIARSYGWKPKKGNLDKVLPEKSIGGDVFYNGEDKLPQKYDRIVSYNKKSEDDLCKLWKRFMKNVPIVTAVRWEIPEPTACSAWEIRMPI